MSKPDLEHSLSELSFDVYVMFFEALCFHDTDTLSKLADVLDSYNKRTDEQRTEIVRRVRKSASEGGV